MTLPRTLLLVLALAACRPAPATRQAPALGATQPLAVGETFTMRSDSIGETRRINVWVPPVYAESATVRLPVLYMPDGGVAEDFVHVMGLLQVSIGNGTMRPFILVGIENTQRRRDMTGPTEDPEDRKIAPRVGGSAAYRAFVRSELIPAIERRYRTTAERAIVGESLAGLFVVESCLREPALFDTCIAIDPSLWWNREGLVAEAPALVRARGTARAPRLWMTTAGDAKENIAATGRIVPALEAAGMAVRYVPMPEEHHATIYHPAALRAFRELFAPR